MILLNRTADNLGDCVHNAKTIRYQGEMVDPAVSVCYPNVGRQRWTVSNCPGRRSPADSGGPGAAGKWPDSREPLRSHLRTAASRKLASRIACFEEDPAEQLAERNLLLPVSIDVATWPQRHEILTVLTRLSSWQRKVNGRDSLAGPTLVSSRLSGYLKLKTRSGATQHR